MLTIRYYQIPTASRQLIHEPPPLFPHDTSSSNYKPRVNNHEYWALDHNHADSCRGFITNWLAAKPLDLFQVQWTPSSTPSLRFLRSGAGRREMLMFIAGACLKSHHHHKIAYGGAAVAYTCVTESYPLQLPLPPATQDNPHTSNRALIFAAFKAVELSLVFSQTEVFDSVVLACDSEYLVEGITDHVPTWVKNEWMMSGEDRPVEDNDMWHLLLEKIREAERWGILVQFWQIPRELNEAYVFAQYAVQSRLASTSAYP
ncbi:hypothetical protein EX30DRAFT_373685 [Ascodesmis nigricans]|uniref:RNase H type-1 domain-containing protein n=1 Tax=Ascodesmis nigricans TaxID=341454 RepID=A0A4S2MNI7_9PEZI|nr:hypothetical protein EX30DRAFT_373685 [Ascodesmis nigricans]